MNKRQQKTLINVLLNEVEELNKTLKHKCEVIENIHVSHDQDLTDLRERMSQLWDENQKLKVSQGQSVNLTVLMNLLSPDFRRQHKIESIKIMRTITACGLREAKEAVEEVISADQRRATSY